MSDAKPQNLTRTYVQLRADATSELLAVDAGFWERLSAGKLGSFRREFMVACFEFDGEWSHWEMHPNGDEIVVLMSGSVTFVFERAYGIEDLVLEKPGEFVVVPKGVWHKAKAHSASCAMFITPGEGTQHRATA